MLKTLSQSDLKAVIQKAATDKDMPDIVSKILADNPSLTDAIVRAVGRNAEATQMLGRAAKTLK